MNRYQIAENGFIFERRMIIAITVCTARKAMKMIGKR